MDVREPSGGSLLTQDGSWTSGYTATVVHLMNRRFIRWGIAE